MPLLAPTLLIALAGAPATDAAPTPTITGTVAFPAPGARLTRLQPKAPAEFGRRRIYLDAGHGTGTNSGARTVDCTDEADFVLEVTQGLAKALTATGHFHVTLSRTNAQGPSYRRRVKAARRARAHALISLHADSRGMTTWWEKAPGQWCLRNPEQPGFSVLFSDEGDARLDRRRRDLARAVARRMAQAGLPAYDGFEYGGLYEDDPVPGVFVDRRRLFMLRKPPMPSVIIETHHALHPDEFARWQEPATRAAFYDAVIAALYDALAKR